MILTSDMILTRKKGTQKVKNTKKWNKGIKQAIQTLNQGSYLVFPSDNLILISS